MKYFFFALTATLFFSCASSNFTVKIPPRNAVEIDFPDFDLYEAKIKNRSGQELDVKVLDKRRDQFIRGFGLEGNGKAKVTVEQNGKLTLRNPSGENMGVKVRVNEKRAITFYEAGEEVFISFTLENKSLKSIPLVIPDVMNPNLSPLSKSAVTLKVGQEILFQEKGKNHVLLVVDPTIEPGAEIDVAQLLKDRKKELGLEEE